MSAEKKKKQQRARRGSGQPWAKSKTFRDLRKEHPEWSAAQIAKKMEDQFEFFVRPEDLKTFGVGISIDQHKKTKPGKSRRGGPTKIVLDDEARKNWPTAKPPAVSTGGKRTRPLTGYRIEEVINASLLMLRLGNPVVRWWDGHALHPIAASFNAFRRSRANADDAPVWPFRPIRIPVPVPGLPAAHRRVVIGVVDATTRQRGPVEWLTSAQWRERSAATRAAVTNARAAGRAMVTALRRRTPRNRVR